MKCVPNDSFRIFPRPAGQNWTDQFADQMYMKQDIVEQVLALAKKVSDTVLADKAAVVANMIGLSGVAGKVAVLVQASSVDMRSVTPQRCRA